MKFISALLWCCLPVVLCADEPSVGDLEAIHATAKVRDGLIYELNAECDGYTNSDYLLIRQLPHLRVLSFSGKNLNDRQLMMLTTLSEVESIQINQGELTDESYSLFAKFPKLKTLSIFHPSQYNKSFTGKGFALLKEMPTLQRLTIAGSEMGDVGMEAIGELTQLKSLGMWHNRETKDGLNNLTKLTQLESIRLGQRLPPWGKDAPISFDNQTLKLLAKIPSLQSIQLLEARLDYDGVIVLKDLPNLKSLTISDCIISAEDIEKLKLAMPNVKIDFQPMTDAKVDQLIQKLRI